MKLRSSIFLQLRIIFALARRNVRAEAQGTHGGIAWAIVEPLVVVLFLRMVIRGQHGGAAPIGDSFEVFLATGFILARTWRQTSVLIANALGKESAHPLPSVIRMDQVISIVMVQFVTCIIVLFIILSIFGLFGATIMPASPLICLLSMISMFALAIIMASIISTLESGFPEIRKIRVIFVLPFFITSGFAFLVDRMPLQIASILVWNPLLHCIEMMREGFYRYYECRLIDITYLFTVILIGLVLALSSERALRQKQRNQIHYDDGSEGYA